MNPVVRATRELRLSLAPLPVAASCARRALHDVGLDAELDHTVTLLASEAVANCVRHAGMSADDRIVFTARVSPESVLVEVVDTGGGFDPAVRHGTEGHGLRLIDRLATRWGTERTTDGNRIWFEVDRQSRPRFERA